MPANKYNLPTTSKLLQRRERLRSMRLLLVEGSFAMVMVAAIEAFYVPYFNAMGASTLEIGLAVSLPALATALVQIFTPVALQKVGSSRKLSTLTTFIQAACFIPFALMSHIHGSLAIWGAIGVYLFLSTAGNLSVASWADWMGNIVPRKWHGRYFANRNRILSLIQITIAISASLLLDHATGKVLVMFSLIWLSCFVARTISGFLLMLIYEPPTAVKEPQKADGFLSFIRSLPQTNFGTFTLATSLLSLAVNFSAPFFAVHMLRNLRLSYVEYTILTVTATATVVVSLGLWGRIIDRLSATAAIRFCATGIALLPLPWVITDNYSVLMCTQALAGFCWAGFNLGVFVYYLNFRGQTTRVSSISYFNAINFFCVFAGATLGGLLGPYLPTIARYQLQTIFVVSVLMRITPVILFHGVKAEKQPQKYSVIERLFFNPKLNIRPGTTRSILRFFKSNI